VGIVKLSPKFQVVIPRDIREKFDLKPGQKTVVIEKGGINQASRRQESSYGHAFAWLARGGVKALCIVGLSGAMFKGDGP
jgi:AbrB family looped-hinge helix DNA binding protein